MLKIVLVDPTPEETNEEICQHNLKTADAKHDLQIFTAATEGWFNLNPSKDYQDLEKELRKNNLSTHLYAATPKIVPNAELVGKDDKIKCKYECIYSCRPSENAIKEVLQHWPTYEENFENLKYAGMLTVADVDTNNDTSIIKFNNEEMNFRKYISTNSKKITYQSVLPFEYIDDVTEQCKKDYGKEPEHIVVGMNNNGGPIMALVVDSVLVSDVGYAIFYEGSEQKMQLVDLATWT